jgi:Xaa-Pro aminopeptidase
MTGPYVPFTEEEFRDRRTRVQRRMSAQRIDLLYVCMPESMYYLHGGQGYWYQGTAAKMWAPTSGTAVHVDHDRLIHFERRGDASRMPNFSVVSDVRAFPADSISYQPRADYGQVDLVKDRVQFVVDELRAEGWLPGTVGLEYWGYRPPRAVSDLFEAAFTAAGCTVVDGTDVLREVRNVKSPAEIACLEEATRIADESILAMREVIRPGMTELALFGEMIRAMTAAGGEMPALVDWAEAGPSKGGHTVSTRRPIQRGDLVSLDVCAVYKRYHSNVVRPFFLGDPPVEHLEAMKVSAGAYDVLCSVAKDSVPIREVNKALRDYYTDAGVDLNPAPETTNFSGWRPWIGGYELGASFPPDWVGNFFFSIHHLEPPGAFAANMVTNFESVVPHASTIDTIVYGADSSRRLSSLPVETIVLD